MTTEQVNGLILILFGLYAAIRFRHNGKTAIKARKKLERIITFNKFGGKIAGSDILIAQIIYL